jgi:uncharacterized membrane protein
MDRSAHRLESLDVLRGVAVVVMVLGHSVDSVLGPAARATELFRVYDALRGFTAPLFLFISGLAFMVATERRWEEYRVPGPLAVKRFGRILVLLLVGYALHLPYFSFEKVFAGASQADRALFFQVDILHCVAVTLLALQVIVMASRTPAVASAMAGGLAAAIAVAAPLIWSADLAGDLPVFLTPYLNAFQPTVFPVVPYAVYMLAGALAGRLYLGARAEGRDAVMLQRMLAVSAAGALLGILSTFVPGQLYPAHDWWKANPAIVLIRLFVVFTLAAAFLGADPRPRPVVRPLVLLGRASFFIYAVHLLLVYGSSANDGLMQIVGQRLDMPAAFAVAVAVLLAMTALVHLHAFLTIRHAAGLATARLFVTVAVTYVFLTRPY